MLLQIEIPKHALSYMSVAITSIVANIHAN